MRNIVIFITSCLMLGCVDGSVGDEPTDAQVGGDAGLLADARPGADTGFWGVDASGGVDASVSADASGNGDASMGEDAGDSGPLPQFGITDDQSHPPPSGGPYPYSPPGAWLPGAAGFPAPGESYVDPVFGLTVRRVSNRHPNQSGSQNYVRNGFWNADASIYMHHLPSCDSELINVHTGAVVQSSAPGCWRASFDPVDPDILYFPNGSTLSQFRVSNGQTSQVKDFGATLESLGGSVDYIDRTGRYFVLNIGGTVRVWDKQQDLLYNGGLSGSAIGTGWVAISPNADYLIVPGNFEFFSYPIDHNNQTLNTSGTLFWTLCGDHADVVSASDGKTYLVVFECWSEAAVYRVDVTLPQQGDNDTQRQKQRDDNVRLIDLDWSDSGHISCASHTGAYGDWCYYSATSEDDTFADQGTWRPYKQEILMMQVVSPFEVRRLAHHRSRSVGDSYQFQPRVSAAWDGSSAIWVSNFGYSSNTYADLWAVELP